MGSTRHEKTFVDFDRPYEQNIIGLRGIIYFGVCLFLLIVASFALMWILLDVMESEAVEADKKAEKPMMMKGDEQLPPEPRLQAAPGFGIDNPEGGRISLQLQAPQAEWLVLQKIWEKELKEGRKDPKTGTVIALPIEEAKKMFLQQSVKAQNNEQGQKALSESRSIVSESSAGRMASEKRR